MSSDSTYPLSVKNNRFVYLERVDKFVSKTYFSTSNLFSKIYTETRHITNILFQSNTGRVPFTEAVSASSEFRPISDGQSFGPTWSTHWFQLNIEIPEAWCGECVRLIWETGCESMLWSELGIALQGFSDSGDFSRQTFTIASKLDNDTLNRTYYIEMACNGLFGAGKETSIAPPDPDKKYQIKRAEIALVDKTVESLYYELILLHDIAKNYADSNEGYRALHIANQIIDCCLSEDYIRAKDLSSSFFSASNGPMQHQVYAVGHCHIDTAWLWPYAETKRKCIRSWSSVLRLLDEGHRFTFACSSAQQFAWVKEDCPSLFQRIKLRVKTWQFLPVGGTWVEMDANIPSGESFFRQFYYGQKFFMEEFGVKCKEFWLPDTFGYSAQIPQIMKCFDMKYFLTQKLSWSLYNKFPHHTFWWEGIDGSRVLAHFPPGDSYGMQGNVAELKQTLDNFKDKSVSNCSLFLFGYGDGGQGPTPEMLEKLTRLSDVAPLPKVKLNATAEDFFRYVEKNDGDKLSRWVGELFLEMHNGTYTTHAKVKQQNRIGECSLHHAEFLCTLAWLCSHLKLVEKASSADPNSNCVYHYPASELEKLWKILLLNQFHDVLPGTSIRDVYVDVFKLYADLSKRCSEITRDALKFLMNSFDQMLVNTDTTSVLLTNSLGCSRSEVVVVKSERNVEGVTPSKTRRLDPEARLLKTQTDRHGNTLAKVTVPAFSVMLVKPTDGDDFAPVSAESSTISSGLIQLANDQIIALIDAYGRIVSLKTRFSSKEAVAPNSFLNQFVIFDDTPLFWDAWDVMEYHLHTRKPVASSEVDLVQASHVVESGPLRASVSFSLRISSDSELTQEIILDAGSPYLVFRTKVEWHETHRLLKVEFPINVRSDFASYETQMGYLKRPTRGNTFWDIAKYEVCAHKWADLSEHDWGVAVLNDCKYGYSCLDNVMRLSLLRSPKSPDPQADMGAHTFTYAVHPHTGTFQSAGVISAAYQLNYPLDTDSSELCTDYAFKLLKSGAIFSVDSNSVVIETIKKAEHHDAVIVRMYESFGSRVTAKLQCSKLLAFKTVFLVNGFEEKIKELTAQPHDVRIDLTPFQIVTLRIHFKN